MIESSQNKFRETFFCYTCWLIWTFLRAQLHFNKTIRFYKILLIHIVMLLVMSHCMSSLILKIINPLVGIVELFKRLLWNFFTTFLVQSTKHVYSERRALNGCSLFCLFKKIPNMISLQVMDGKSSKIAVLPIFEKF